MDVHSQVVQQVLLKGRQDICMAYGYDGLTLVMR